MVEEKLEELNTHIVQALGPARIEFPQGIVNSVMDLGNEGSSVELVGMNRDLHESNEVQQERMNVQNSRRNSNSANICPPLNQNQKLIKAINQFQSNVLRAIESVDRSLYYLKLSKMHENVEPESVAMQEMKDLAVIVNRITGIILTALNVGLLIYTGLVMFTSYEGF